MKYLLITHTDLDGISPVILLKLYNQKFDFHSIEIFDIETFLKEKLKEDLSIYEKIYITDLSLSEKCHKIIDESDYKDKVFIFDHHSSHLFAREYKNVTIDIDECGTSVFYNYLEKEYGKINNGVSEYVNHVKDIDIWTWEKNNNRDAVRLNNLFLLFGKELFIEQMYEKLIDSENFYFNKLELSFIESEEKRIKEYLILKEKEIYMINYLNKKAIVIYANKHKSELGSHLATKYPNVDYVILINAAGGISFRTKKENIDLTEIAGIIGGGGHKKASGAKFPKEMQEKIILELFKGSDIIDENKTN